jgi:hypothetical protein
LVRKSSWEQTSVQWDCTALARCPQRREAALLSPHGGRGLFLSCSDLRDSIVIAVRDGALSVLDEQG